MPYLSRLIHRCQIERATVTLNELRERVLTFAVLASDVPCLLVEKAGRVLQDQFGRDLQADAALYVPPGQDVRPATDYGNGRPDRVTVTDHLGRVTVWYCLGVVPLDGPHRRGCLAALRHWSN